MNVSELFNLTQWITREVVEPQIIEKYQALQSILQMNLQPHQAKQPFELQKDSLIETIKNVPTFQLSKDQLYFLKKIGIADSLGKEGIEAIEDILYKNVIDIATSAQKLQEIIQKLNEGISKSNQISVGLSDCITEEKYESEDEILMRVSFTGHASMSNVKDFKNWGNIWYEVGRGIAMAHNLSPEDVKIVGATNGSIILEIAVVAKIAGTVSGIILAALKVAEKILDLRKKSEEIRGMKLLNDKIAKELDDEAENQKKAGVDEITKEITIKLELHNNSEGDKVAALEKAVKNLVNFIEKGGHVDFIIPDDDEEHDENDIKKNDELRVAFQQIRQLEKKIELLEHIDS